jgi:hypothetical protein
MLTNGIINAVADQFRWQLDERYDGINQQRMRISEEAWRLREARERISRRGARRTALKALDAASKLRDRGTASWEEAGRLRDEIYALRDELVRTKRELAEARTAARREPLPIPTDYQPPHLEPGSVLCQALAPSEVIYALVDPRDPELVRYVGRTCDPALRYRSHLTGGSDAVASWAHTLAAQSVMPAMMLLERCEKEVVVEREAYWIRHYRARFQADLNRALPREAEASPMRAVL